MKVLKLDLLGNAKSSLRHAVEHLTSTTELSTDNYKFAITSIVHAIELIFKEKLKRVHPAFMWRNVDKYPNKEAHTVSINEALRRLIKIADVKLENPQAINIESIKKLRNEIEHYEFEIVEQTAKTHIGRMLSFIFWFTYDYLELDWETEFKKDDSWSEILDIYDFFMEHVVVIENRMAKEDSNVTDCPNCGGYTFDLDEGECAICDEKEQVEACENCKRLELSYKMIDYDNGPYMQSERLCEWCAAPPYEND
jgi:hypothetical protein